MFQEFMNHDYWSSCPAHEITVAHWSLSGTIRFLPVTMTSRFSNFISISYKEDRHKLRVTGTKCRLPDTMDTMSGTGKIFISGTDMLLSLLNCCHSPCTRTSKTLYLTFFLEFMPLTLHSEMTRVGTSCRSRHGRTLLPHQLRLRRNT